LPPLEFYAEVESAANWPLFIRGSYNRLGETLTYALILKTEEQIYTLDMGKDRHNPECMQGGDKHKHRWTEQFRYKEAAG
jgi:hypothetical protein